MDPLFRQRTRIVATLGPSCSDSATLERLIEDCTMDEPVKRRRSYLRHYSRSKSLYASSAYRDVRTFLMPTYARNRDRLVADAQALLLSHGVVELGDLLVVTDGGSIHTAGGANTLKIVRVGEKFNA